MQTSFPISRKDRELLQHIQNHFPRSDAPLCPDFYQLLEDTGIDAVNPIRGYFNHLLLDNPTDIIAAFQISSALNYPQLITIFDHYLACLARRFPGALNDANQTRIALEAARRLAFSIMHQIVPFHPLLVEKHDELKPDPSQIKMIDGDSFLSECGHLLKTHSNPDIAILAIRLEFSTESSKRLQSITLEVAQRLKEAIRQSDILGQLSLRRWAICLSDIDNEELAMLAASKVHNLFTTPFFSGGKQVTVTPHIGIALSQSFTNEPNKLLNAALKTSVAAQGGGVDYLVYNPEKDAEERRLAKLSDELRKAIHDNELELHYQPKYCISSNKIIGLEALLRWNRTAGRVDLVQVFNLIERDDLLEEFTQWLLQTACRQLKEFLEVGIDIQLSINIVPKNLEQSDFCLSLRNILGIWNPPLDRLCIEITESSMMADTETTLARLQEIRNLGLKLSMDDFGTGYSSLSYLSRLPIDEIKIDQSFVRKMHHSDLDAAIVRTIVELAHNFKLSLVAEGVEDEQTALKLSQLGCDVIQGYLISKPISSENLIRWFKNDTLGIWQRLLVEKAS